MRFEECDGSGNDAPVLEALSISDFEITISEGEQELFVGSGVNA